MRYKFKIILMLYYTATLSTEGFSDTLPDQVMTFTHFVQDYASKNYRLKTHQKENLFLPY